MQEHPGQVHRGTFPELRPLLLGALDSIDPEDRETVLTLMRGELEKSELPTPVEPIHRGIHRDITGHESYYAFHTEDIKLLKEASLITAGVIGLMTLSKGPLGVIGALVVLLFRYRRRRVPLSGEEGVVLLTLRRAPPGGWTVDELALNLPLKTELDSKQLIPILERLQNMIREDGTRTKLVDHAGEQWWTVDV